MKRFTIGTRKQLCGTMMTLLGLGANMNSAWGTPFHTILHVLQLVDAKGITIRARSPLYETAPLGVRNQADFVNAVVLAYTSLPPYALLNVLKDLEQAAGRRGAQKWGPRPLDIDILDYAGRVINWPHSRIPMLRHTTRSDDTSRNCVVRRSRPPLITPHPQMHRRAFVLQPLADIMPRWHHPVSGESASQLLRALPRDRRGAEGQIERVLPAAA